MRAAESLSAGPRGAAPERGGVPRAPVGVGPVRVARRTHMRDRSVRVRDHIAFAHHDPFDACRGDPTGPFLDTPGAPRGAGPWPWGGGAHDGAACSAQRASPAPGRKRWEPGRRRSVATRSAIGVWLTRRSAAVPHLSVRGTRSGGEERSGLKSVARISESCDALGGLVREARQESAPRSLCAELHPPPNLPEHRPG